jgi:hypothetical protein
MTEPLLHCAQIDSSQRSPNYYERWLGAEDRKPYGRNLYLAFGKAHTEEAA